MPDLALLPDHSIVFVDTNIFDLHFRSKSVTCTSFIRRIARNEITAFVNTQVLSDLLHKLMLAEAQMKGYIQGMKATQLKSWLNSNRSLASNLTEYQNHFENTLSMGIKVLSITGKRLKESKSERASYGLLVGDSIHLHCMNCCPSHISNIATYDGDFEHIPNVIVWKPTDIV